MEPTSSTHTSRLQRGLQPLLPGGLGLPIGDEALRRPREVFLHLRDRLGLLLWRESGELAAPWRRSRQLS